MPKQGNSAHKLGTPAHRLGTNVHAKWTKGPQFVCKVHLCKFSPRSTTCVLPDHADREMVRTMTRLLKVIANLVIVPQSGRTHMLLSPLGKSPIRLSSIHKKGPVAAQSTDDNIDDICRLACKMTADRELAFRPLYAGDGRDMPAHMTPWSTTRVRSRSKAVAPRGEQARVHKEIPKVDIPPVSNQRGLRK